MEGPSARDGNSTRLILPIPSVKLSKQNVIHSGGTMLTWIFSSLHCPSSMSSGRGISAPDDMSNGDVRSKFCHRGFEHERIRCYLRNSRRIPSRFASFPPFLRSSAHSAGFRSKVTNGKLRLRLHRLSFRLKMIDNAHWISLARWNL